MSAKPKPERNPEERADLFIASHQAAYSEAITGAREAAATTCTQAWQNSYRQNMSTHRDVVNQHVKTIVGQCDTIKTMDSSEDFEKDIRDSVKSLADERIRYSAWRSRTIKPFQDAAEKCENLSMATVRAADQAERENPLIDRGLLDDIKRRVNLWPKAAWDDERGVVEIIDTATGEVSA